MKLKQCWEHAWPIYHLMALQQGRLPGYRDWRKPMVQVGGSNREIGGISILFFIHDPLYTQFVPETQLDKATPTGHHRGYFCGHSDSAIPLYRLVDLSGKTPNGRADLRPPCTWQQWTRTLGYRISTGTHYRVDGRSIQAPQRHPDDHAAEVTRIVAHLEWQRNDGHGYLGGEFLFLMLAPHFRLNCATLKASPQLQQEIERFEADLDFVEAQSLAAGALAATLITALGPEHLAHYLDALEPPAQQTISVMNGILGGAQ